MVISLALQAAATDPVPMWTDVVSAVGTGLAALIALLLGYLSLRLTVRERHDRIARENVVAEREREARSAEKRSQAERLTCWMEARDDKYPANRIIVHNASEQPVWEVTVLDEVLREGSHLIPVIQALGEQIIDVDSQGKILPPRVVEVRFRDNRAAVWRRLATSHGTLVEEPIDAARG